MLGWNVILLHSSFVGRDVYLVPTLDSFLLLSLTEFFFFLLFLLSPGSSVLRRKFALRSLEGAGLDQSLRDNSRRSPRGSSSGFVLLHGCRGCFLQFDTVLSLHVILRLHPLVLKLHRVNLAKCFFMRHLGCWCCLRYGIRVVVLSLVEGFQIGWRSFERHLSVFIGLLIKLIDSLLGENVWLISVGLFLTLNLHFWCLRLLESIGRVWYVFPDRRRNRRQCALRKNSRKRLEHFLS